MNDALHAWLAHASAKALTADYSAVLALALAPAFLLSAAFSLMAVLTGRLQRIREILRGRAEREPAADQAAADRSKARLTDRARLLYRAIRATTLASLAIALTVLAIFINKALGLEREWGASALFVLSIFLITRSSYLLYKEIRIAHKSFEDGDY